jgi:hypothetical protein
VARWVKSAGRTAAISATRSVALRQQWQQFPRFLSQLKPTMAQLGALADQQIPLMRQLRATTPQLHRFFADLGPFSEASRPSIRTLGQASVIGNKAFKDSKQEIAELKALAPNAPSAAKQTRQFLQSFDDRNRSTEADTRAQQTAPPAPDPTAYKAGQGFTGFESLLNYTYWQTLALNPYDQLGHLLRVALVVGPCSPFQTGPVDASNNDLFAKCNSWLGPNQPGVTTPDPTDKSYAALKAKASSKNSKSDAGQPRATKPLPGNDNPSVPHPVLPPAVKQLLQQLQLPANTPNLDPNNLTGQVPSAPAAPQTSAPTDNKSASKLLDFLLSP